MIQMITDFMLIILQIGLDWFQNRSLFREIEGSGISEY